MAELVFPTVQYLTEEEFEALDVALKTATDEEVGAALVRSVGWHSFNPQIKLTKRFVKRAPAARLDEALSHVAFALYRHQPIPDLEHFDVLDALVAAGARADALPPDTIPMSALHSLAMAWGRTPFDNHKKSLVKKIEKVVRRADAVFEAALRSVKHVDLVDGNGSSALHLAVLNSRIDRVKQLLAAGANPALKNSGGKDAVAIARKSSAVAMPAILEALGAA